MRSCEYLYIDKDKNTNSRKTKLLRVKNFRFLKDNEFIDIYSQHSIYNASSVIITFEFQKNRNKNESIKMDCNPSQLCPVKIWASVISRILSYPKGSLNSSINLYREKRSYHFINSTTMREALRQTVENIGSKQLGISPKNVGTHSIRSSFAMLLLLNKIPLE